MIFMIHKKLITVFYLILSLCKQTSCFLFVFRFYDCPVLTICSFLPLHSPFPSFEPLVLDRMWVNDFINMTFHLAFILLFFRNRLTCIWRQSSLDFNQSDLLIDKLLTISQNLGPISSFEAIWWTWL